MDAFESIVASLLHREGFWTQSCVKVKLTREDKIAIGRRSSPRWEVDIVAYRGASNELWVVECKSFLNSRGVLFSGFDGTDAKMAKRYKLFNDAVLRDTVLSRLREQLVTEHFCAANPSMRLVMAAGKIATPRDAELLHAHFTSMQWTLWDREQIVARLERLAGEAYENAVAPIVCKLLQVPRSAGRRRKAAGVSVAG